MISAMDSRDKWFLDRWSNFTASEIWKLEKKGSDGSGFSVGGISYIEDKVIESMTDMAERPELDFVEPLLHGKMYELPAFNNYVKVSRNYNMKYFGDDNPVYVPFNDFSGGTPDAAMGEGEKVYLIGEIKCPKSSKIHYKYCKMKTQWDLKQIRPQYYAQIQFLMMCLKADEGHFISFDDRFRDANKKIKILEVKPDSKFQDNIELRVHAAQKEKLRMIAEW